MSTLKVNSIEPANAGSEDYFLARAWVNFNGQGTVAIRASGNVSSITDYGTGHYGMNFSNAMIDTNFGDFGFGHQDTAGGVSATWVANGARYAFVTTQSRLAYANGSGDALNYSAQVIR